MNLYWSSKILRETRELVLMSNGSLIPRVREEEGRQIYSDWTAHIDTGISYREMSCYSVSRLSNMRFLLCDPGHYRYRRLFTGTIQLNFACQGRTSYPSATKLVSRTSEGNSILGLSEGAPMHGGVVVTSLSLAGTSPRSRRSRRNSLFSEGWCRTRFGRIYGYAMDIS